MIAAALAPLTAYRQFILYRLSPSRTRPGKTDKFPVNWQTMEVASAHDPAAWLDYDTAEALAPLCGPDYGVGFVLTAADSFWCLDIDGCLQADNTWSPAALAICAKLPGAAIEVSQSGRGLHIWGSGRLPPHGCKNVAFGLELYDDKRFIALGQPGAVGNAATDLTAAAAVVIAEYFPPDAGAAAAPTDWTDGPCREGAGVPDDNDLLRKALASNSSATAFGGKATFAQLWEGDEDALSRAYPDNYGQRAYDASSADAGLAQRLAFWTANDCGRIQRLMLQSGLVREKWEREDYLHRTILSAVGRQTEVYERKPAEAVETAGDMTGGRPVSGRTLLGVDDQVKAFAGHTYVRDLRRILLPDGALLSKESFDDWYGGNSFVLDDANTKTTTSAWECFTSSRMYRFPKVHHAAFRPSMPPGTIWREEGKDRVNTYVPIATARKTGDPSRFLDHLAKLLPVKRDRDILLAYFAAVVQYPGVKFQWCPLIQGCPGNGKSFLGECVTEAIGRAYWFSPKAAELTSKFNDWIYQRLLVTVEDICVPAHKADTIEALKPMITSGYLEIEGKGTDRATREVCANFILNSNHKDAIRKTQDDRRFAVFYCAQQSADDLKRDGMGGDYFPDLYDWARKGGFAIVNDFLRAYQIPDELNPATRCHRAPATSSTMEACRASLGPIEQEIEHAIDQEQPGFRGGYISSVYLDRLLRDLGAERSVPRNKRRALLKDLGYLPHSGLPEGRVNNPVNPDGPGVKPRLYLLAGHPDQSLRGAEIVRAYEEAQRDPTPAPATAAVLAFRAG